MKILLTFLFLTIVKHGFGQEKTQLNYLLVRIEMIFDNTNQRNTFVISAENGCDIARDIYSLKKYEFKKNAINTDGFFYYNQKDTAGSLYNYFLSTTEALNYISRCGWKLFSIYNEITSGYNDDLKDGLGNYMPITTVSSRPVFCFTK